LVRGRDAEHAQRLVARPRHESAAVKLDRGPDLRERRTRRLPYSLGVERPSPPRLDAGDVGKENRDRLQPRRLGAPAGTDRRILVEDRLVEVSQLRARLDPDLLNERLSRLAVRV